MESQPFDSRPEGLGLRAAEGVNLYPAADQLKSLFITPLRMR